MFSFLKRKPATDKLALALNEYSQKLSTVCEAIQADRLATVESLTSALHCHEQELSSISNQAVAERAAATENIALSLSEHCKKLSLIAEKLDIEKQSKSLVHALDQNTRQSMATEKRFEQVSARPLPVQTFPMIDDLRWESEKQQMAAKGAALFCGLQQKFVAEFARAHCEVGKATDQLFKCLDNHGKSVSRSKSKELDSALNQLLRCSPKNVIATFQKLSLEAGWEYVFTFNTLIDFLAKNYPRCRGGFYAARLNYADVLQISEEIIATLRATSTILEDIQRRYELLDGLQNELRSDLDSAEITKIWEAVKGSFSDNFAMMKDEDGFWNKVGKATMAVPTSAVTGAVALVAAPTAQFQGQLAREHRIRVFIATSAMLRQGWKDWYQANLSVVEPNLKIMFALKADFISNKVISLCDILTANGYNLETIVSDFHIVSENKQKGLTYGHR